MLHEERDLRGLEHDCREAAARLLARHRWQLLDQAELAERALACVAGGVAADSLRGALCAYSQTLHRACSGAEGSLRQNIAYGELFRYLYDSALRRYPDVVEDAAQGALLRIFSAFDRCRQPGAFLAFAFQHLIDSARAARRHLAPREATFDAQAVAGEPIDLDAEVIARDLRARFDRLAAEFLRRHPRARRQLDALRLKYVDGLDEAAISERLQTPVPTLYVLRSRAIRKLRSDPSWRALAAEFGLLGDDEVQESRGRTPL